jgi:hypothetical protein
MPDPPLATQSVLEVAPSIQEVASPPKLHLLAKQFKSG